MPLLTELILHSETRNRVGGGDPGDDEAAGGDLGHRLGDVDHGWRLGGLPLGRRHYRRKVRGKTTRVD